MGSDEAVIAALNFPGRQPEINQRNQGIHHPNPAALTGVVLSCQSLPDRGESS